jgi:hypothetical protein
VSCFRVVIDLIIIISSSVINSKSSQNVFVVNGKFILDPLIDAFLLLLLVKCLRVLLEMQCHCVHWTDWCSQDMAQITPSQEGDSLTLRPDFPSVLFPSSFIPKRCVHFSSLPRAPHTAHRALIIPSSMTLILLGEQYEV